MKFKKGSAAAKAFMAKLRAARGKKKSAPKKKIGAVKKKAVKKRTIKKSAPKKKAAVRNYGSHKDTGSHNVKIHVVSGVKRNTGYIGRIIVKKYTLTELKKLNPLYFQKGQDRMFGVYKRKLMITKKFGQVMVEAHKKVFGGEVFRDYSVRVISSDGQIETGKTFNTLLSASNYIEKNIIL